jgi:hypothetical protein
MFSVPACPEWASVPGYKEQLCFCVKSCGHPVKDCRSCKGQGLAAAVPMGVYHHYKSQMDMPNWIGDPRFDPRAGPHWDERPVAKPRPQPAVRQPPVVMIANWFAALPLGFRALLVLLVLMFDAAVVVGFVLYFRR